MEKTVLYDSTIYDVHRSNEPYLMRLSNNTSYAVGFTANKNFDGLELANLLKTAFARYRQYDKYPNFLSLHVFVPGKLYHGAGSWTESQRCEGRFIGYSEDVLKQPIGYFDELVDKILRSYNSIKHLEKFVDGVKNFITEELFDEEPKP